MVLLILFLEGFFFPSATAGFPPNPLYGYRAQLLKSPQPKIMPMPIPKEREQQFFVLTTELFPGVLLHSPYPEVRLFSHLASWGLGAPTYCAIPTRRGVQVLRRGYTFNGEQQSEAWLLVWFAHSENWAYWDAPILVVLQHRPNGIHLGQEGLSLFFPKQAGDIVILPLYGYYKPPQEGKDFLEEHHLPSRGIRPWEWVRGLPREVLQRCRTLARMSRAFPLYSRETFALEGDSLLLKAQFTWRRIADDWNTPVKKLAPLPPALGIAWWAGKTGQAQKPFPMKISHKIQDPEVFTPYGPWLGVEDTDSYEIRFPLLSYIHQTEEPRPPNLRVHPSVKSALDWVQQRMRQKFATTDWNQIWDHGGPNNYCWQVMGDRWYAKILPYLPQDVRHRVSSSLRGYIQSYVLKPEHYKPFRGVLLLVGPGIGTWGGYDDAGKFSSNLLETLWCYGHFTGDWQTLAQHWGTIKKFFVTPLECDWKSFGRYAIAEMGDEASPPLAMARMAYRIGDYETYAFASYIFIRELVHHYIKQVGAQYFRIHQPWHSLEWMPEEVYLTNLWGDVAGWQIDGPTYPKQTGERQYNNRWVRFSSEDVARFYRDTLLPEVQREINLLTERAKKDSSLTPYRLEEDTAHIAPSILRLRSLLLNEPPEKLARLVPPEKWKLGRSADGVAFCWSFLKASARPRLIRLIPPQKKTSYVLGLERAVIGGAPILVLAIETTRRGEPSFPVLRWWGWRPPKRAEGLPGENFWGFGQVVLPHLRPKGVQFQRLNWNTGVYLYEMEGESLGER